MRALPVSMFVAAALPLAGCGARTDGSLCPSDAATSVVAITNQPAKADDDVTPARGELLTIVTAGDGVPELHVHTKRPYRIVIHKRTPEGEPRTTTVLLNGAHAVD